MQGLESCKMNPVRELSLNGVKIPESIRDKKAVEKVLRQDIVSTPAANLSTDTLSNIIGIKNLILLSTSGNCFLRCR